MLLIFHDVMAADVCHQLIQEHDSNPDKQILDHRDTAFAGRVLFLQKMTAPTKEITAHLTMEVAGILSRHFLLGLYPETVSTVFWGAGHEMLLHKDGQMPHTAIRTHAVVIYLNTQEEGGEIYFPELGTTIAPRQALLVAYPKTMLHGVRPVVTPRYTLTMWFTDKAERSIIRLS